MTTPRLSVLLAVLAGGLLLSGCSSGVQETAGGACIARLSEMRAVFEVSPPVGDESRGCGISNPVTVTQADTKWSRPAVVTCELAEAMVQFEQRVVQPAAMRYFGQPVTRLHHMGTYSCRNRTGGLRNRTGGLRNRLSEHAFGRAIDIGGFELADGSRIDVRKHWSTGDNRAAFLREVARGACGRFSVVLTPNHDRYHQDHLHLDKGRYSLCGL